MFFYVFFLRPPPTQISPSSLVTFTPQLANDLRTQDFTGEVDIYYSWSLVSLSISEPYPTITAPQKLTVWRPSNFKEVSIPLPPRARDGQSYRLVLTTRQHGKSHIMNLASCGVGEKPFPVMSMPILISSRARAGNVEKQQQIERVYRVPLQSDKDCFLTIQEQTSFDLDKKVWDSGIGLSSWLVEVAQSPPSEDASRALIFRAKRALFSADARKIIELGSGTGIVSLTLGALRSGQASGNEGCIITTDLESALPLLNHNVSTNGLLFRSSSTCPLPLALDWDDDLLPEDVRTVDSGFDVIIMADVTYNTASFPVLVRTLSALIDLSPPSDPPLIILGYKMRDPEERTLWDMVRAIGVAFEQVGERAGAGREPVEIWIGRRDRREAV